MQAHAGGGQQPAETSAHQAATCDARSNKRSSQQPEQVLTQAAACDAPRAAGQRQAETSAHSGGDLVLAPTSATVKTSTETS
jgi:hypothetical protein